MKIAEPQNVWLSLFLSLLFEPMKKALSDRLWASPSVHPSAHDLVMSLDLGKRGEFGLDGRFDIVGILREGRGTQKSAVKRLRRTEKKLFQDRGSRLHGTAPKLPPFLPHAPA